MAVKRLGLPSWLERQRSATNSIENVIGSVRRLGSRVKRWRVREFVVSWRLVSAKIGADVGGFGSIGQVDSTDFETVLAKLLDGAVVEIRELDTVWSKDTETQRIISNLRLAFILEREREPGAKEPPATHCAIVTVEQARTLLAAGAKWYGAAAADPRTD